MKKWRRMRPLWELLAELESRDFDRREYALFQLGLILERSNQIDGLDSAYVELPRELLRLNLSEREQEVVAEKLSDLIRASVESRSTAFWTLGKVQPSLLSKHMLDLICEVGSQLGEEAAYQSCDALRRCLVADGARTAFGPARARVANLRQILALWRESGDARLRNAAAIALGVLRDDAL